MLDKLHMGLYEAAWIFICSRVLQCNKETQISITAVTNVYWMTVFQNYIHRHIEMSE